jgi:hypothetical protein
LGRQACWIRTPFYGEGGGIRSRLAAEVLAPVAVNIAIEVAGHGLEVGPLIELVANYGASIPAAGQKIFARHAADAIESQDLGAAGWVERRLTAAIEAANDTGADRRVMVAGNRASTVSVSANGELAV